MKKLVMIAVLGAAAAIVGGDVQAGEKKSSSPKTYWTCRVPVIRNTPLCPTYNQKMIEYYSPKIPVSRGGSTWR